MGEETLKINKWHYDQLSRRFHDCQQGAESSAEQEIRFHSALFRLLLRYKALSGGGFQCALPPSVWAVLKGELGVELEGFASPLNCTLGRFCSAFADTDTAFGSAGSVFRVLPQVESGAVSLNPPYVTGYYTRLADAVLKRLEESNRAGLALSFTMVVGATERVRGQPWFTQLTQSRFVRITLPRFSDGCVLRPLA